MSGPEVENVRYERARLTVAKTGSLAGDDRLGEAIDAYERGEARAGAVAIAYLRARVIDHSPSFSWREARLGKLIPLVTSVSTDPAIEAQTSTELANKLVRLRRVARAATALEPDAVPRSSFDEAARFDPVSEPVAVPLRPTVPTRRAAPDLRRRLAVLVGGLAALAVAIVLFLNYLGGAPDRLADDYRATAGPAVKEVADVMDTVFDGFDLYLSGQEAEFASDAIRDARATIDAQRTQLAKVPDPPLIGAGDADEAIDAARFRGEAYLDESRRFLDDLERFLDLEPAEADARARAFYRRTIELAEEAEAVEETLFALGTGDGDADGADHYRPAPPTSLPRPG